MAKRDDVQWSEASYTTRGLIRAFEGNFPCVILVTNGFCGQDDIETLAAHQMARIHTWVKQRRVLAKDARGRYLTVPMDYPIKFEPFEKRGRRGKPRSLADICSIYSLPQAVQFERKVRWDFRIGQKHYTTDNFGRLDLLRAYDEKFLKGNSIIDGAIDSKVLLIPTYVSIKMKVAEGLLCGTDDTWYNVLDMWGRAVSNVRFDLMKGSKDIMMYSWSGTSNEKEYIGQKTTYRPPRLDSSTPPAEVAESESSTLMRMSPNWTLQMQMKPSSDTVSLATDDWSTSTGVPPLRHMNVVQVRLQENGSQIIRATSPPSVIDSVDNATVSSSVTASSLSTALGGELPRSQPVLGSRYGMRLIRGGPALPEGMHLRTISRVERSHSFHTRGTTGSVERSMAGRVGNDRGNVNGADASTLPYVRRAGVERARAKIRYQPVQTYYRETNDGQLRISLAARNQQLAQQFDAVHQRRSRSAVTRSDVDVRRPPPPEYRSLRRPSPPECGSLRRTAAENEANNDESDTTLEPVNGDVLYHGPVLQRSANVIASEIIAEDGQRIESAASPPIIRTQSNGRRGPDAPKSRKEAGRKTDAQAQVHHGDSTSDTPETPNTPDTQAFLKEEVNKTAELARVIMDRENPVVGLHNGNGINGSASDDQDEVAKENGDHLVWNNRNGKVNGTHGHDDDDHERERNEQNESLDLKQVELRRNKMVKRREARQMLSKQQQQQQQQQNAEEQQKMNGSMDSVRQSIIELDNFLQKQGGVDSTHGSVASRKMPHFLEAADNEITVL